MRASSAAGVVILGGLLAVAVARSRRARCTSSAPARPSAAAAPVHPPAAPPPAVSPPVPAPEPAPPFAMTALEATAPLATPALEPTLSLAAFAGATALAPALDPEPWIDREERPVLRLVAASEPEAPRWETCEIRLWRGYVSWQLVAANPTTSSTVAVSPAFRARRVKSAVGATPTQTEAARRAVESLQRMLEAHGWERVGDGDAWYEGRFRRRS